MTRAIGRSQVAALVQQRDMYRAMAAASNPASAALMKTLTDPKGAPAGSADGAVEGERAARRQAEAKAAEMVCAGEMVKARQFLYWRHVSSLFRWLPSFLQERTAAELRAACAEKEARVRQLEEAVRDVDRQHRESSRMLQVVGSTERRRRGGWR